MTRDAARRARPDASELIPWAERVAWLAGFRVVVAGLVIGAALVDARSWPMAPETTVTASLVYLVASLAATWAARRGRHIIGLVNSALLADVAFLAFVRYVDGGPFGPLAFVVFAHICAVTVLVSRRTGYKVTVAHSLAVLAALSLATEGYLRVGVAGRPWNPWVVGAAAIGAMWLVAGCAALFSSVNERELREQKARLVALSAMVARMDAMTAPADVARLLLDTLRDAFDVRGGVVLLGTLTDLEVVSTTEPGGDAPPARGLDASMERAVHERTSQLVRVLDERQDPRLARLLPGRSNVIVVPMLGPRGTCSGFVALACRDHAGLKRSSVLLIERYVSHGALTLANASLITGLQEQLDRNEVLQARLAMQNSWLEAEVAKRTAEIRGHLEHLGTAHDERRRLLQRLAGAQETERTRIAHDIHDDPLQKLAAVAMDIHVLRSTNTDPRNDAALRRMLEAIDTASSGLRDMIFELRPPTLDQRGLAPAITEYVARMGDRFTCNVDDRTREGPDGETRALLFRVAQEALSNIRKHADADVVEVVLADVDGGFLLSVRDDGVGFDAPETMTSPAGHLGLTAMRERAESRGGWVEVRSSRGDGTLVDMWVPARPARTDIANGHPSYVSARLA